MVETVPSDLTGKLLVAMPGMGDPRFEGSVVFLCAHSDEGAMGLIINKTADGIEIRDVFKQLEIEPSTYMHPVPVHYGGPVESGRGFVLHSQDYQTDMASMEIDESFSMTASRDILRDMAAGGGPHNRILCLGYAGWGPGQLEAEIGQNGWLTCDADAAIVFETANPEKWQAALGSMGVSAALLSGEAGHA